MRCKYAVSNTSQQQGQFQEISNIGFEKALLSSRDSSLFLGQQNCQRYKHNMVWRYPTRLPSICYMAILLCWVLFLCLFQDSVQHCQSFSLLFAASCLCLLLRKCSILLYTNSDVLDGMPRKCKIRRRQCCFI